MKKTFLLSLIALLTIILLPTTVSATNVVAKIGEKSYDSLTSAIADVPTDGTETTIVLASDEEAAAGFKVKEGQNIIIDFDGHVYDASIPTVGSTGTETNGCQLLKGSKVTFKNGTLKSTTAKILIQNYCDLTIQDMTIDITGSNVGLYALSNNNGKINVKGNTNIKSNNVAFDVCWWPNGYADGAQVTIDTTGMVVGDIELGDYKNTSNLASKCSLTIKNINHKGKFSILKEELASTMSITGGIFDEDVTKYAKEGYVVEKLENERYLVKANEVTTEIPEVKENSKEPEIGVSESIQESISAILKEEAEKNTKVQEALNEGKNVQVKVEISKIEKTNVSKEEQEKLDEFLGEETVAQYFDISLVITADGVEIDKIKEASDKIKFTLLVPKDLLKSGRTFYIIKIHDGKVEKLDVTQKENLLEFSTDEFSTYLLAYTDAKKDVKDEKDETPKTGMSNVTLYALVAIASIAISGIVVAKKINIEK